MMPLSSAALMFALLAATGAHAADSPTRFWNLTGETITHLYLAPAGTARWGNDQCKNDSDGTVDFDERLRITHTAPGQYDIKLVDRRGRVCIIKNVTVAAGRVFSIGREQLTECTG